MGKEKVYYLTESDLRKINEDGDITIIDKDGTHVRLVFDDEQPVWEPSDYTMSPEEKEYHENLVVPDDAKSDQPDWSAGQCSD